MRQHTLKLGQKKNVRTLRRLSFDTYRVKGKVLVPILNLLALFLTWTWVGNVYFQKAGKLGFWIESKQITHPLRAGVLKSVHIRPVMVISDRQIVIHCIPIGSAYSKTVSAPYASINWPPRLRCLPREDITNKKGWWLPTLSRWRISPTAISGFDDRLTRYDTEETCLRSFVHGKDDVWGTMFNFSGKEL